jgi:hypothetical protein
MPISRGTGTLARTVLPQAKAYAPPHAAAAAIETKLGNYSFRATTIAVYTLRRQYVRKSSCDGLKRARRARCSAMSLGTTRLILDEIERIAI